MFSRCVAACVGLAVAFAVSRAEARATARLVYAQPEGVPHCPPEATLRGMVARQLGYDPFEDASPITIEASIERLGTRLRGRVLVRREGAPSAERVVDGSSDCANVANALALTLALALDTIESSPELPPLPPPVLPPVPAVEGARSARATTVAARSGGCVAVHAFAAGVFRHRP